MDRKWFIGGFTVLAAAIVASHLMNYQHKTSFDKSTSETPFAAEQNNFYPLGTLSRVGTRMATPQRAYGSLGTPNQSWEQGGTSSITHSTGLFAQ